MGFNDKLEIIQNKTIFLDIITFNQEMRILIVIQENCQWDDNMKYDRDGFIVHEKIFENII